MTPEIGFMQGRLSELVNGRIQAFPWDEWEKEFDTASRLDFHLMEWTLDQERLYENPLMNAAGRSRIRELSGRYHLRIESLTGDFFMQAPFYKSEGDARRNLLRDIDAVISSCAELGIKYIVLPLVDNGSLENPDQENVLVDELLARMDKLKRGNIALIFESDFGPARLRDFIAKFPAGLFGINYDIGNSAALGFNAEEEINLYGDRILNVHVKDRKLGGTTVPLGEGNADFEKVFSALAHRGYKGNFILQTARAADGNHAGALVSYRTRVKGLLNKIGPAS